MSINTDCFVVVVAADAAAVSVVVVVVDPKNIPLKFGENRISKS